jgi:hypothetical protein
MPIKYCKKPFVKYRLLLLSGLFPVSTRTTGSGTSLAAGPSSGGSLITTEMFSQAMQQAIANVGPNTGGSHTSGDAAMTVSISF